MSDEFLPPGLDLLAPRADFRGTRPLIWRAGRILGNDLDMSRALVQPTLHFRLEFKPDTSQDAIHALQRDLAFLLESAGLLGGYANDEQYMVISLLLPMSEADGEPIVNWLSAHPAVAVVRYSDVQSLAQVLANTAGRELGEELPLASALLFSLIRSMVPEWRMQRWMLRQARQAREGSTTPDANEEAGS